MNKSKSKQNIVQNGLERIEEIKTEIQSCKRDPSFCKAEVYEMWEGVFTDADENTEEEN